MTLQDIFDQMTAERSRINEEMRQVDAAIDSFPGHDASQEAIEAWRAANPWPWFEELRAYTLANSERNVREYQMQWEPEAVRDPVELP